MTGGAVWKQEAHLGKEVMNVTAGTEGMDVGRKGSLRAKPAAGLRPVSLLVRFVFDLRDLNVCVG